MFIFQIQISPRTITNPSPTLKIFTPPPFHPNPNSLIKTSAARKNSIPSIPPKQNFSHHAVMPKKDFTNVSTVEM